VAGHVAKTEEAAAVGVAAAAAAELVVEVAAAVAGLDCSPGVTCAFCQLLLVGLWLEGLREVSLLSAAFAAGPGHWIDIATCLPLILAVTVRLVRGSSRSQAHTPKLSHALSDAGLCACFVCLVASTYSLP
jgi:hypothetical protein